MIYGRLTYAQALEKAEHLKGLGETTVYLDGEESDMPWNLADSVESGGGYRLNGPTGCYILAHVDGLTLKWSVDFEGRDANGRSVSLFDRDRLRGVAMKLSPAARAALGGFLEKEVLPALKSRTSEIRAALNSQADSEDCVRGLIAYAKSA